MKIWCLIPNLILYCLGAIFYLGFPLGSSLRLTEQRRLLYSDFARIFVLFGALLHLTYLIMLHVEGRSTFLILESFGLILLFLWLVWRYKWDVLGPFFIPLVLFLLLFSLFKDPEASWFHNISWLVPFHVVAAQIAFVFMGGNLLLGISYWMQEKNLKTKRWTCFFVELPPLVVNEKRARVFLHLGFTFLTFALLTGFLLASRNLEITARPPMHGLWALLSWFIYGLVLVQTERRGVQGRKILLLCLFGFVSLGLLYIWI